MAEEREHRSGPEQGERSYSEGLDDRKDLPEEERIGRFSEGEERLPDEDPEKHHEGRFSEGEERLPDADPEKHREGRFSEGQEKTPPDAAD